jgi:hypothetical protein
MQQQQQEHYNNKNAILELEYELFFLRNEQIIVNKGSTGTMTEQYSCLWINTQKPNYTIASKPCFDINPNAVEYKI